MLSLAIVAIIISALFVSKSITKKPKVIPHFREDITVEARSKMPPGVFETIPSKYDPAI